MSRLCRCLVSPESSCRPRLSTAESIPCASADVTHGRHSFEELFLGKTPATTRAALPTNKATFRGMAGKSFQSDGTPSWRLARVRIRIAAWTIRQKDCVPISTVYQHVSPAHTPGL